MVALFLGRNCTSSLSSFAYPKIFHNNRLGLLCTNQKRSNLLRLHRKSRLTELSSRSEFKSKIFSTTSETFIDKENWKNQASENFISNILVCGDGDLSFSAEIAASLNECSVKLIATVLEDEKTHCDVYQRSNINKDRITSFPEGNHEVKFGVDATKLKEMFPGRKFDRIRFNFPHWRGKANHRYNRQLIDAFLKSASLVLAQDGEIHVALCEGQGGSNAKSLQEYRDTWTPSYYASMHGLMLIDLFPFEVCNCLLIV